METKPSIWITGANGFVGTAFCRHLLQQGQPVVGLVRALDRATGLQEIQGLQIVAADTGDLEALENLAKSTPPAVVVHCAASVGPERTDAEQANVKSVQNLLDLSSTYPFHLIHISTISVYDLGKSLEVDESAPLYTEVMEENLYGTTKAIGDKLVQNAIKHEELTATILRPGAILGLHPRSSWSQRVPLRLQDKGVKAMPIPLQSPMPWLMIESFCHALDLCIGQPAAKGRIFNLFDEVRPWQDYLQPICDAFDLPISDAQSAPGVVFPKFFADKIRRELGYAPQRGFEDSMQEALKFLKQSGK